MRIAGLDSALFLAATEGQRRTNGIVYALRDAGVEHSSDRGELGITYTPGAAYLAMAALLAAVAYVLHQAWCVAAV